MKYCIVETMNTGEMTKVSFNRYQDAAEYLLTSLLEMQSHTRRSSVCYQTELATLVSPETFRMWQLVKE